MIPLIVPIAVSIADGEPIDDIADKRPCRDRQHIDDKHPEHGYLMDVRECGCKPSRYAKRIENHVEGIMIVK